ncbi:proline rich transmembrane protein 1B-like [Lytechinus variegatus]|uniref:proline rich transmembrane protein 1B-like n=1 Tax=Lytechinus variegatus TaxID=7654 RepID=UPI001BB24A2F|nr:proline rich transmembrane protein 1B-like [Lytechinus variegatus]
MINQVPDTTAAPVDPQTHTTVIVRQAQPMPDDHFIFALLVTIFCCLPLGVVAILKSVNVKTRYNAGDFTGAEQASKGASKWAKIALVTGILFNIAWIVAVCVYYFLFVKAVTSAFESLGDY